MDTTGLENIYAHHDQGDLMTALQMPNIEEQLATVDYDDDSVAIATAATIDNDNTTIEQPLPLQPLTPATTKSVTFGTHDEFYQWDEQLDVLKYVDDEFFEVANFLMEDVDDDGLAEVGAWEDEESRLNKQQRRGGILSILFGGCSGGGIETDDCYDNSRGRKYHSRRKYQLTEKLVNDFYSAVKFRMEKIEANSACCEGEENQENDVATRTREIALRINAYGLPFLRTGAKIEISGDENEGVSASVVDVGDTEDNDRDDYYFDQDDFEDEDDDGEDAEFVSMSEVYVVLHYSHQNIPCSSRALIHILCNTS